ncbi:MAG: hypothetical protein DRJ03_00575 [Chloroflexi bacterium]|nr:MAG: hypothetical protein DRJ03_00575 [Chloroflexota bacterium]
MAKIRFVVQPTAKTMAQLIKGVKQEGSRLWARRVLARASSVSKEIGTMLVKTFDNTDVAKALRGQGANDLPAHLGLDDGTAHALADGMAKLIQSSVHILSRGAGDSVSIKIQAVEDNWSDYLGLPGAQYVSHPSNITIPVARWLLIDPSIDIGQAAYDIVFKGEDEKFDVRIQKVSRSGRAIMVSLKALGGSGGYVLPSIISGQGGQNFIEYALRQPNVAVEAATILMKKVR